MEITTARILDKRRMLKKSKTYRLAIRVTYDRKPVPFLLDLHVSEKDFRKLWSPHLGKELREIRDKFIAEEDRAKEIIRNLGTFTFDAFREEFYRNKKRRKPKAKAIQHEPATLESEKMRSPLPHKSEGHNRKYGQRRYDRIRSNINYAEWGPLAFAFGEYIKLLEAQERIGTCESYFSTIISLLKFKNNLRFEDITVAFLYEYEKYMLDRSISPATIGIHLRNLRCIFNNQIADDLLPAKYYPFGKRKYQIPAGANVKKALDLLEIKRIYDYIPDPNIKNEAYCRDMWLFGYFSNGINPMDIAHLKFKNIDDGFIIIKREKIKFTTRSNPRNIMIPIIEDMQVIIDRWCNRDKDPENYIFPILRPGLSAHRRYELVQGFTGVMNDRMKVIATKIGISKKVTTMTWRHSYATILKRSGVSTEFIQESLGHTDVRTTENYLDSFELEIKRKFSAYLTSFKDIRQVQTLEQS